MITQLRASRANCKGLRFHQMFASITFNDSLNTFTNGSPEYGKTGVFVRTSHTLG